MNTKKNLGFIIHNLDTVDEFSLRHIRGGANNGICCEINEGCNVNKPCDTFKEKPSEPVK